MGKPTRNVYDSFVKKYYDINKKIHKNQFLVPYLMSSHPGSDLKAAIELAQYIKKMGYTPEQVQDFYPTPGSLSTTMYYTGINPLTEEKVYIPKDQKEKRMQRALLQFSIHDNYDLVKEALIKAHREDLIGNGPDCLIPYNKPYKKSHKKNNAKNNNNHYNKNNNYNKNKDISKKNKKNSLSKHKKRK